VKDARPDARIVAVEPEGSAALHAALYAGRPVRIVPTSIADGLNAPFAGRRCLAVCRTLVDESITVTEAEIAEGFRFLYRRAKLAAEPAAAAGIGALLAGKIPDLEGRTVVSVVSGGNVSAGIASDILAPDED
jgi:threonine dehydratase